MCMSVILFIDAKLLLGNDIIEKISYRCASKAGHLLVYFDSANWFKSYMKDLIQKYKYK